MPYVRSRGNQVLIVHGERESGTGSVVQRTLFTLYSRAEAREAVGEGAGRFEHGLQREYPDLRFDWKRIRREITRLAPGLPETYDHAEVRQHGRFREALRLFARELMLNAPQALSSSARLVASSRTELEYLGELLKFRLAACEGEESPFTRDDEFRWRFSLQGRELPLDVEEDLQGILDRGERDRAEKLFHLAVDCFPGYADGYNSLGVIALDRGRLDEAIDFFEKTVEAGRRLFPRRTARSSYGRVEATRPYLRGLRNLALALERSGRWADALAVCDRLEDECGDVASALATRSTVWLSTGRFAEAVGASEALLGLGGEMAFVVALARYETGRPRAALAAFLHGALNAPRTARMLAGKGTSRPSTGAEVRDHNHGVELLRSLRGYLEGPGRAARRFLVRALAEPTFASLLAEQAELWRRHDDEVRERTPPPSETFRRLSEREKLPFALARASVIADALGLPLEAPLLAERTAVRGRRKARPVH